MSNDNQIASIPNSGVISLSTVLRRLECTTSRLEDIILSQSGQGTQKNVDNTSSATVPVQSQQPSQPSQQSVQKSPIIEEYNSWIDNLLNPYLDLSNQIGDLVKDQSSIVKELFIQTRDRILVKVINCKKPKNLSSFQDSLSPLVSLLTSISELTESNESRKSKFYQNLKTVNEGIQAAGWITVEDKPGPFINEIKDSSQFYANRVIKDFKNQEEIHVTWAKSFITLLDELRKYVMKYHTTGLAWNNAKGVDFESYNESENNSSIPPPPAPPASPVPATVPAPVSGNAQPAGPEAVFAELNKGEDITKGLRKVDKSEMTHKNPQLRSQDPVSSSTKPQLPAKPKSLTRTTSSQKKPSKTELDGQKWFIENHENNNNIIIEDTAISHTVNIFSCKHTTIQIKGKVNAVNLVGCQKTSVLMENLVSSLSITSSPSFTVQVLGVAPTILVDATDSGQIYLSKQCIENDVEIVTAKASSINVSIPDEEEEGVFAEKPIPEQFKTKVENGKLVTTVVEHSG